MCTYLVSLVLKMQTWSFNASALVFKSLWDHQIEDPIYLIPYTINVNVWMPIYDSLSMET